MANAPKEPRRANLARAIYFIINWMPWSSLRSLGQSRAIRSSYFWLVAVPVLAKTLIYVAGDHEIAVFGKQWQIHIGLPFQWILFYSASVLFVLAHMVYFVRCPTIVDSYLNFGQFSAANSLAAGEEFSRLVGEMSPEIIRTVEEWKASFAAHGGDLREFSQQLCCSPLYQALVRDYITADEMESCLRGKTAVHEIVSKIGPYDRDWIFNTDRKAESLASRFWLFRQYGDRARPIARTICTAFFGGGIALMAVVSIQGLASVIKLLLK